ncbi:MAG TPA: dihydrolipoyl dehydrogenase [Rectinemataceae bacterium]|nr:dihydrolipoyl dehydrogenase [Rectinemataceae bacterium]
MPDTSYDLVVIGSGPGGYVAAIRAAQLGLKVAIVEREALGGVCLNVGCIPSKALIHSASLFREGKAALEAAGAKVDLSGFDYAAVWRGSRKAADRLSKGVGFLLKKNGVEVLKGEAKLEGPRQVGVTGIGRVDAAAIILATGSRPKTVPGFEFDEATVLSSTGALMADSLPRRLIVLGAGAIGMETAFVMNAFGVDVTVVELMERVLPLEDAESAALVAKEFQRRGVKLLTGMKASRLERGASGVVLALSDREGAESSVEADRILVAIGRTPNTEGLGLEEIGIRLERGFVPVGAWQETQVAGVYAIGDIVSTPLLAHVASKEGEIAAERIAQLLKEGPAPAETHVDPLLVPNAVYCEPELASFGLSEERAIAAGRPHRVARFPYRGVGKAVATERPDGQAKLVLDPATGAILGASIVGAEATELVHELLVAARAELRLEDLADAIHAHPTLSELVMETARAGLGRAIHA